MLGTRLPAADGPKTAGFEIGPGRYLLGVHVRGRAGRPEAAIAEPPPAAELTGAPLTSATVAAFTLGVTATTAAWAGIAAVETAAAGFLALVMGLVLAVPTLGTAFLGHLSVRRSSALRGSATAQWMIMVAAVSLFLVAAALLDDGYRSGHVPGSGVGVAAGAELMLVVGAVLPALGGRRGTAVPPL